MSGRGLSIMVAGALHPLCGCCLESPANGAFSKPFGAVCDECFDDLRAAEVALNGAGLVGCLPLGPDHEVGGAS